MSLYHLYHATESLLVPLIVLACATSVAARYMPRTRERIKSGLAARLGGASATGWRARAVARLAPTVTAGCASGCESGGCNTCASNTASPRMPAEQPIRLVRNTKRGDDRRHAETGTQRFQPRG